MSSFEGEETFLFVIGRESDRVGGRGAIVTKRVSTRRAVVGGSVAAVIIAGVAGYLPGVILASDLTVWHESLGSLYRQPSPTFSVIFFTMMAWVFGVTAVWMYATTSHADESG